MYIPFICAYFLLMFVVLPMAVILTAFFWGTSERVQRTFTAPRDPREPVVHGFEVMPVIDRETREN